MQKRRTAVFLIALIALAAGLYTGRDVLFKIAYAFALLIILSFAWSYISINYVYLSRITRTKRTQVGQPLEERFLVRNTSHIPKLWLEIRDFTNLPGHFSSHVVNSLGRKSTYSWRVNTTCLERGRYQLGPIRLSSSDPFGLFPMQKEYDVTNNIVVYPITYDIHQFALPLGLLSGGEALRRRTHYVTTNAAGVREYAPGDSYSRIHWRSTARRNRLIVKEFELDPLADIWIVPDMATFGHFALEEKRPIPKNIAEASAWWRKGEFTLRQSTEEYTVTIAASLARYFLRHDRSVGMAAYGQSHEIVQPDRGERQINRILETLSVLQADGQVLLHDMLHAESHHFPRGTTLIVVTPTTRESWVATARQLSRRGLRIVTVLVDPEGFGGYKSAAPLATLLNASNMLSYIVQNGDDITAVLSQRTKSSTIPTAT